VKKIKYVAASNEFEAWQRFRAKLTSDTIEDARETSETLYLADSCEEKCVYDIYAVKIELENLEDGYAL
jgi:hypothetical protein